MSGSRSAAPPSLSGSAAAIDAQAPAADLRRPAPEPAHEVFSDDDDGNYMDDEDYYDDVAVRDPSCFPALCLPPPVLMMPAGRSAVQLRKLSRQAGRRPRARPP